MTEKQLGRTGDWVVLYWYDDHHWEGQATIVTETHGPLEGRRVVRGRGAGVCELVRLPSRRRVEGRGGSPLSRSLAGPWGVPRTS
ncbi:MAG TPA: hypothetical protein VMT85_00020 [Thermoanaerobaculia bacterium]|nr:hypothetical protein [Thermoanaerobaculia bacterium]